MVSLLHQWMQIDEPHTQTRSNLGVTRLSSFLTLKSLSCPVHSDLQASAHLNYLDVRIEK